MLTATPQPRTPLFGELSHVYDGASAEVCRGEFTRATRAALLMGSGRDGEARALLEQLLRERPEYFEDPVRLEYSRPAAETSATRSVTRDASPMAQWQM